MCNATDVLIITLVCVCVHVRAFLLASSSIAYDTPRTLVSMLSSKTKREPARTPTNISHEHQLHSYRLVNGNKYNRIRNIPSA